ncbi:MAG TPA: hypothetical protein VKB91_07150, partial [Gemmatimonadaceae bacterium]|nr:hypothetical protein [Gemmatimonadaceae bacterium]
MRRVAVLGVSLAVFACNSDNVTPPPPPAESQALAVLGKGVVSDRYTGEVWVRGSIAYTTTWGTRENQGNAINIWDVSGNVPTLVN